MNEKIKKYFRKKQRYIFCTRPNFYWGPECLHQLAFYISKIFKIQTYIYYLPNDIKKPVHKNFRHYKIKYTNIIEDQKTTF